MLKKSKNLIIFTTVLNITINFLIIFFNYKYNLSTINKNFLPDNTLILEIKSLSEKQVKLNILEDTLLSFDDDYVVLKDLEHLNGSAIYFNNLDFLNINLSKVKLDYIINDSYSALISERFKENNVNDFISIDNSLFFINSCFKNDNNKLSDIFINLLNKEFLNFSSIDGTYYINSSDNNSEKIIKLILDVLNKNEIEFTYRINTLENYKLNILSKIINDDKFFIIIFIALILLMLLNVNNHIFIWLNKKYDEIFCRKVVGATNFQIISFIFKEYIKIAFFNIFISIITILFLKQYINFSINLLNIELLYMILVNILIFILILFYYFLLFNSKKFILERGDLNKSI